MKNILFVLSLMVPGLSFASDHACINKIVRGLKFRSIEVSKSIPYYEDLQYFVAAACQELPITIENGTSRVRVNPWFGPSDLMQLPCDESDEKLSEYPLVTIDVSPKCELKITNIEILLSLKD